MDNKTLELKQKLENGSTLAKDLYELEKEELLKHISELREFGVPEHLVKNLEQNILKCMLYNGKYVIRQTILSQITKMGIFE